MKNEDIKNNNKIVAAIMKENLLFVIHENDIKAYDVSFNQNNYSVNLSECKVHVSTREK